MEEKLKEIKEKDGEYSLLILANNEDFREVSYDSVRYLTNNEEEVIYFTTNKPCREVIEELEFVGANLDRVNFLDVITKKLNLEPKEREDTYYGDTPAEINNLNVYLTDVLDKWGEKDKFIILDSFTGLLIYNSLKTTGKFIQRMKKKIAEQDMKGICVAIKSQIDEEVIEKLMKVCDEKLDLS